MPADLVLGIWFLVSWNLVSWIGFRISDFGFPYKIFMPREFLLDPADIDLNQVIVDLDGIRKVNP